ncbi:MAG: DNA repair protein RecO [Oscillospiraceae bacterium]|jgi:DNA repair protein RecO (recombination protein O)|nr:DNA repair protein RecO [Oscillospiraceae bacterium]
MLITVDGLVIARRDAGDSSCYVDILTEEYGVIEILARGVKKITSQNAPSAAIFTYAVFCLDKKALTYTLNSARSKYSFHNLSADMRTLSLAAYFSEVIKYASASEQNNGGALRLMLMALYELEKGRTPALIKAVFELRASSELGMAPNLVACANCARYAGGNMFLPVKDGVIFCEDCYGAAGAAGAVFKMPPEVLKAARYTLYSPPERIFKFRAPENVLKEFSAIAEEYLLYHLGRGFKTLEYYKGLNKIND